MKFVESPDFSEPGVYTIHDVGVSTLALFGTAQLKEAARSGYKDFNIAEIKRKIKSILQLQLYLLYRWALTRYVISHNIKGSFVKQKFFDVTPDSFLPEVEDIDIYFEKPAFLWRLSAFNYKNLCLLFLAKGKAINITLHTYVSDPSNMLEYIETKQSFFPRSIFQSHVSSLERIDAIQGYYKYNLSKYEQSEIYFSQDYFLNMMDATTCYAEFVKVLLTGLCERYKCQLLKTKLDSKGKELFQFTPNYYVIPKYAIDHFADLVKIRKKEVAIQNKLIIDTTWVEEARLTTMFPLYTFSRFLRRILGNKLMINKFRWQDKCGKNVIIGVELPCSIEKEIWLVLTYFMLTKHYPWLNCFMYTGKNISKDTFELIEKEFKKIEKSFYKLSQTQVEEDIKVMSTTLKEEDRLPVDEVNFNSPHSTITSIFDTTFHRNRRKFNNVKTIHPNGLDSLPFEYSATSATETEVGTNPQISCKPIEVTYNECFSVQRESQDVVDVRICLSIPIKEVSEIDLSWSLYNHETGDIRPFAKIHGVVNDMMESTLDLMGVMLQEEAYRQNIVITKPESVAFYLAQTNINFNPNLISLQKDIKRVKTQIIRASTQHATFVENLFKILILKDMFEKIIEGLTIEQLEKFLFSSYNFSTQIEEFRDLIDSFGEATIVNVRWFIKPNGFIELLGF